MTNLYDELTALTEGVHYGYERQGKIRSAVASRAQDIIVAVGGYKLIVTLVGDLLISIRPKATSIQRGEMCLDPHDSRKNTLYPSGPYANVVYAFDPCGPQRLKEAIAIVGMAAVTSKGDREAFYAALGRSGFCAVCGTPLTDDLSRARGIGPECYKKIYVTAADARKVQEKRIKAAK